MVLILLLAAKTAAVILVGLLIATWIVMFILDSAAASQMWPVDVVTLATLGIRDFHSAGNVHVTPME